MLAHGGRLSARSAVHTSTFVSDTCCPATSPQAAAEAVGKKLAELCKAKNIEKVAFDRGGFAYHGRIQVRVRFRVHDVRNSSRQGPRSCAARTGSGDVLVVDRQWRWQISDGKDS